MCSDAEDVDGFFKIMNLNESERKNSDNALRYEEKYFNIKKQIDRLDDVFARMIKQYKRHKERI